MAALLSTAAACAVLVGAGLGGGDSRSDAGQLAAQDPAADAAARTLLLSYPWPALFAIGGDGERGEGVARRRRSDEREANEPVTSRAAADRGRDDSSRSPDRGEARRTTRTAVRQPSGRSPARARARDKAPRSGPVGDRPTRRRRARDEGSPRSTPAPAQPPPPVPQAAPEPAPPAEPLEPAEGDEPPGGGKPPQGEELPKQGEVPPKSRGRGKPPRAGRQDQR